MPCFHPLKAFRSASGEIVFHEPRNAVESLTLPCGRCVGCRLERSRQWAVRCVHEAQMFQNNCFITLTYDNDSLPCVRGTDVPTLDMGHFQKFMKRLRKRFQGLEPVPGEDGSMHYPIRFFHAGEYGEKFGRPHYHACIFNFDFPDKIFLRKSPTGHKLYRSKALEELWPYGHSSIGSVTFESAAYVARYIMKKVNGDAAHSHYCVSTDIETGELLSRAPEYTTMSRRPGIGSLWLDKFMADVYPHDYVVLPSGRKCRPPKYYDNLLKAISPEQFEELHYERHERAKKSLDDSTPDRLRVREQVQLAKLSTLKRKID